MNKKAKSVMKAIAAGATFAVTLGDVIDNFAKTQNHPAWYTHYPVENLVTLNFGQRENLAASERSVTLATIGTNVYEWRKPTDAMITISLTRPKAEGVEVIDQAAALLLQQIRSVATTTAPYAKEDIRVLLENARAIVAMYSIARRASGEFELTDTYDADAFFKYILLGLGNNFNYNDIASGIAEFRAKMGAVTPLIRNLIPLNIDLMERTKWMFSNIFADSPSAKFSTKQFTLHDVTMIDANGDKHIFALSQLTNAYEGEGTVAKPFVAVTTHARYHVANGFTGIPDMIREMVTLMTSNPMTSRVLGDILKAFGQKAFMDFPDFNPHARTPIVYDEDILNQIQNLVFAINTPLLDSDIQGTFSNSTTGVSSAVFSKKMVNTYRDVIPVGKLLSITRLAPFAQMTGTVKVTVGGSDVDQYLEELTTVGTEVAQSYSWIDRTAQGANGPYCVMVGPGSRMDVGPLNAQQMQAVMTAWATDDYAPMLFGPANGTNRAGLYDGQNWAVLTEDDAATYHTYAALSLCMLHELVQKSDTFQFVN